MLFIHSLFYGMGEGRLEGEVEGSWGDITYVVERERERIGGMSGDR